MNIYIFITKKKIYFIKYKIDVFNLNINRIDFLFYLLLKNIF